VNGGNDLFKAVPAITAELEKKFSYPLGPEFLSERTCRRDAIFIKL